MKETKPTNQESAGKLINEISRGSQMYFQYKFKEYNIGHAQVRTLFHIASHEGLTQKQIGEHLNLDKSSITSQLQILERNGYIIRTTSKLDARMQVIDITDKTREIMKPIRKVLSSWTETLLDGFNETERTNIFNYLGRMRANAKNKLSQIQNTSTEKE